MRDVIITSYPASSLDRLYKFQCPLVDIVTSSWVRVKQLGLFPPPQNRAGVSNAYLGTKDDMRELVEKLAQLKPVDKPIAASQLSGRWELVYTTVELFRASPFFQMVCVYLYTRPQPTLKADCGRGRSEFDKWPKAGQVAMSKAKRRCMNPKGRGAEAVGCRRVRCDGWQ